MIRQLKTAKKQRYPLRLLLQWHITERCNLRCAHCYQETHSGKELEFCELLDVLRQFKELLNIMRMENGRAYGHITITGGEPFIRSDFLGLLDILSANRKYFSFAILTNGSFIDDAMARCLRNLKTAFIQVSIDGSKFTHDSIRGTGNFEKTVSAIKCLVRENIRTFIAFTAHRGNFREFGDVAALGRQLHVSRVWADRLIPRGSGSTMLALTHEETQEFFEIMNRERKKSSIIFFRKTEIAMHRALQFLFAGGEPYHCTAGDTLITVQPDGDLVPCRRMPIKVGNLMDTPLVELYNNSELFGALRNCISEGCSDCFYSKLCRGGLRCLSYAMSGDPFRSDPSCWYASPPIGK